MKILIALVIGAIAGLLLWGVLGLLLEMISYQIAKKIEILAPVFAIAGASLGAFLNARSSK